MMREGHDMEQWRQQAPEEFLDFIDSQTTSIRSEFDTQYSQIEGHAARAKAAMKPGHTQKDLALWVQNNVPKEDRGFVFPMIQRGKIEGNKLNGLWDRIKPPAEKGFWLAGDGKVEGES
jgi:hypothetical protein